MLIPIILIIIYALNIIDYFQTAYTISLFGIGVEANPIGRFLFENNCAWVMKIIITPILLFAMGVIVKLDKKQAWAVWLLLITYICLVVSNFNTMTHLGIF